MSKDLSQRTEELRLLGWTEDGAKRYLDLLDESPIDLASSQEVKIIVILLLFVLLIILLGWINRLYSVKNNKEILSDLPEEQEVLHTPITEHILMDSIDELKEERIHNSKKKDTYQIKDLSFKPFLNFFQETSIDTDKLIKHIILISLISYEGFLNLYKLSTNNLDVGRNDLKINKDHSLRKALLKKTNEELRESLLGIELLPDLGRDQLINIILTSPEASRKIELQERRIQLMNKKNVDLKLLLKGEEKIARLKKKDLVDKILQIEFGETSSTDKSF